MSDPAPARPRRLLGLDSDQRDEQRRQLVLAAALEHFGTVGFAATSIEVLCKTAGVGTNSFYRVFPTKEAVLIALYDDLAEQIRAAVAEAYFTHAGTEASVGPMVEAFAHAVTDDPRVARVAFLELAGVSPTMEEHRRRARETFIVGIEAIGAQLVAAATGGAPPDRSAGRSSNPRRNAVGLVGAIIEMTVDWLQDDDPCPLDELIADITAFCVRLLDSLIAPQVEAGSPRATSRRHR